MVFVEEPYVDNPDDVRHQRMCALKSVLPAYTIVSYMKLDVMRLGLSLTLYLGFIAHSAVAGVFHP